MDKLTCMMLNFLRATSDVCSSVTRVDQSKWLKLGSCNFYQSSAIPPVFVV